MLDLRHLMLYTGTETNLLVLVKLIRDLFKCLKSLLPYIMMQAALLNGTLTVMSSPSSAKPSTVLVM
jgi:hypothetical protein